MFSADQIAACVFPVLSVHLLFACLCWDTMALRVRLSGSSEVNAAHIPLRIPYLFSVFSQPVTPTILTTSLWIVLSTVEDGHLVCRSAFNFWFRGDLGSVNDEGLTSVYSRGHIYP